MGFWDEKERIHLFLAVVAVIIFVSIVSFIYLTKLDNKVTGLDRKIDNITFDKLAEKAGIGETCMEPYLYNYKCSTNDGSYRLGLYFYRGQVMNLSGASCVFTDVSEEDTDGTCAFMAFTRN